MSQSAHTYGPTCRLAPRVSFSGYKGDDDCPDLKAQFFYRSQLPIDDPLSVVPTPSGSESKSVKHPLRPFSAHDNDALEESWLGLSSGKDKKHNKKGKDAQDGKGSSAKKDTQASKWTKLGRGSKNVKVSQDERYPQASKVSERPENTPQVAGKDSQAPKAAEQSQVSKSAQASQSSTDSHAPKPLLKTSKPAKDSEAVKRGKESQVLEGKHGNTSTTSIAAPASSAGAAHLKSSGTAEAPEDIQGNPSCNDSSSCCADMEIDMPAGHQECVVKINFTTLPEQIDKSKSHKSKKDKHTPNRKDPGISQGDGMDESLSKDLKGPSESESSEHRAFLKHEHSKAHQDFEKHLNVEHSGRLPDPHGLEPVPKEPRLFGRSRSPGPPSEKPETTTQSQGYFPPITHDQEDNAGITGKPFVKLPSRKPSPQRQPHQGSNHEDAENQKTVGQSLGHFRGISRKTDEADYAETEVVHVHGCKAHKNAKENADVPVGISRLHLVKMPALQMQPIYWSPAHDEASVTRGTWFYKDTMYPVEPAVANQLESGYRELRCWSKTWDDELRSAAEVGAAGEEKIAHRLWPKDIDSKDASKKGTHPHLSTDPYCAARCFHGETAAEGSIDSGEKSSEPGVITKKYSNAKVIYKDAQNAFILKPNLQPSAYYGRKPLQKIKKGTTVGIHVVRGFDWNSWDKLHRSKKTNVTSKAEENAPVAGDADAAKSEFCPACRSREDRTKVTDLVLVIHGIGQKLSERVESYNFTHAMNGFRRSITAEFGNDAVKKVCRKDLGGIMVLPVNWRSKLSFEGEDPVKDDNQTGLSLNDITQPTIPAVRSLISDVMLDIPYYLSHHKSKMIQAVISEANRVYRLWCKNNPNFHQEGRVHIIAHSLGSVMAVDILSKQPTSVPKVDFHGKKINAKHFDFNTTNLFCAGSPAGFFFYLEKAKLLPRSGRGKPGAEYRDEYDKKVTGEAGTFGCMAVDNVYNIMHCNDPIAYRLNATVDPQYAASLKNAHVPSATTGFFESIGNAMRSITPGVSSADHGVGEVPRPSSVARLPSQLELEVHDFTREEIAERKLYLLNDNGQIDWCLNSGGGPLEIQYINMLGAHSSYWTSPDFVRMLVTEVGRKPGKSCTLPNMRAAKIGHKST